MRPTLAIIGLGLLTAGMALSWFGVVSDPAATKVFAFLAAWFSITSYSQRTYPEWWGGKPGDKGEGR